MNANPQQPKEQQGAISTLNALIEALNLAKEVVSITPAKAVLGSASVLLVMIRVNLLDVFVGSQAEMDLGCDDQPSGLCRTWAGVRQCLSRPQSRIGRKELE